YSSETRSAFSSVYWIYAAAVISPFTLSVVRDMSRIRSTPYMSAMASPGTPMEMRMVTITGNDPPGTPAVPTPAKIQSNTTVICDTTVSSTLNTWARNRTVMPSKRAVPFWLPVLPMVSTKWAIGFGILSFSMLTRMAVGKVALLELVEKAVSVTSPMSFMNCTGLRLAKYFSMIGYTTNWCMASAPSTTSTYHSNEIRKSAPTFNTMLNSKAATP